LFIDDDAIEGLIGLEKKLHQPRIQGPVIEAVGEQQSVQSRSVPQWNSEKQVWEWWYWANHRVEPYGQWHSTAIQYVHYAESSDGLEWEQPDLGLYTFREPYNSNLAMDPEAGARSLYHIIRDEIDRDDARRYKAMMGNYDRRPHVSPDGFNWTALDTPQIRSSDESHLAFDTVNNRFIATVKQGTDWGRSIFLSTSDDFEQWSPTELVFHSDDQDHINRRQRVRDVVADPKRLSPPLVDDGDYMAETYQMAVLPYEGLYVGFPALFNPAGAIPPPQMNHTGLNQTELTVSRDLRRWDRVCDRALFLDVEEWNGTNYGTAQTLPCGQPIVCEDEIRIYACGRYRHADHQAIRVFW
jgi:hypothetical protein